MLETGVAVVVTHMLLSGIHGLFKMLFVLFVCLFSVCVPMFITGKETASFMPLSQFSHGFWEHLTN